MYNNQNNINQSAESKCPYSKIKTKYLIEKILKDSHVFCIKTGHSGDLSQDKYKKRDEFIRSECSSQTESMFRVSVCPVVFINFSIQGKRQYRKISFKLIYLSL